MAALREVFVHLLKLEERPDLEGRTVWTLEREITLAIRRRLAAELSGDELPQQLQNRVRRLVQEELGIAPGPTTQHQQIEARRSSSK